ncbi:MAG: hypothetical protein KC613_04320 [Myxococcales bacterium]|nr:hypothetical protein [Myxococcales bacterium]MCB9522991.1 hypothetical protein [Myxococcales bacterium]
MFQPTLAHIVKKVDGAMGAAVLSLEGLVIEAIDGAGQPMTPEPALADAYGPVFKQLIEAGDAVDAGELDRLTIESPDRAWLVRRLSEHYVAALTVRAGTALSKAHYHLRVAAPDLAKEL